MREQKETVSAQISRADEQLRALKREEEIQRERYTELHQRTKDAAFRASQVEEKLNNTRVALDEKKNLRQSLKDNVEILRTSIERLSSDIEADKTRREGHRTAVEAIKEQNNALYRDRQMITERLSDLATSIADKLQKDVNGSEYSKAFRMSAEKNFFSEMKKAETVLRERVDHLKKIASVDFEREVFLDAVDDAGESIQAELLELKGAFQEFSGTIPEFLDEFTDPEGILSQRISLDSSLKKNYAAEDENNRKTADLSVEIERISRGLILKESDLNDMRLEMREYSTKIESLNSQIADTEDLLRQIEADYGDAKSASAEEKSREDEVLSQIENIGVRRDELNTILEDRRASLKELSLRIDEKNSEISRENSVFQAKFDRRQTLMTDLATDRANLQSLDENIQKVYKDFFDETGKSLRDYDKQEITTPVDDLKAELESVKKRIQDLGYINYMAEDEYNEAKKNYDFYKKNLDDLNDARADLTQVIEEIRLRSEEMFQTTFDQIKDAFQEMFQTLFGGGRARLSLTDPDDVLSSGIEIEAEPPGKKMTYLPSLSGGEKSMTAVALLFATYKVKPSPFCILDEIDAALDARNIGSFLKVLEKFGDASQFIIITHNKGTVLGSDTLLGVTQEEPGVSKAVGYKIEDVEKEALKGANTLKS